MQEALRVSIRISEKDSEKARADVKTAIAEARRGFGLPLSAPRGGP